MEGKAVHATYPRFLPDAILNITLVSTSNTLIWNATNRVKLGTIVFQHGGQSGGMKGTYIIMENHKAKLLHILEDALVWKS